MRCPSCHDEYEDTVTTCRSCGVPLVPDDAVDAAPPPPSVDTRLGTFHPAAVTLVLALLDTRGVPHETRTTGQGIEVLVPYEWRDDLRAELTLTWGELVRRLDEDATLAVLGAGGSTPGWYDAPHGGYVDRAGRLVVAVDDDEVEDDAARVVGPALLTVGAILVVLGWWMFDSAAVAVAGVALAILGLVTPR
jgi:hypothetical protein